MKERETYMLCCDCGHAVKQSTMFVKKYANTAICLCKKCAKDLKIEIEDYSQKQQGGNDEQREKA